jgi:hypothetical protein
MRPTQISEARGQDDLVAIVHRVKQVVCVKG